jgi:signal transduction histidine kinase
VVVAIEALALAVGALLLLYLVVTSTADSVGAALGEVVFVGAGAAVLAAAAVGLWRVAAWARGPVVVLQLLLAALAYTAAFEAGRPAIGLPVLALVVVEIYLLATPESRLAYSQR